MAGFEPAVSWSQTTRVTKLRYTQVRAFQPTVLVGTLAVSGSALVRARPPPESMQQGVVLRVGFEPASSGLKGRYHDH